MKPFLCLPVLSALLLGGCAGNSSEFECNATTSDRCMTMEQANELARKKTDTATTGKPDATRLPALVELPAPAVSPLSLPSGLRPLPNVPSAPATAPAMPIRPAAQPGKQATFTPAKPGSTPLHTDAQCTTARCDTLGEATPLRLIDTMATLWIAPWIDDADVFHQPGRVSFVLIPGTWQLPQQLN